jgi:hypothetical protein
MTAGHPTSTTDDASAITPGLLVLHGNRLEALRDAVLAWLALRPLAPLEEEVLLVQSNGAAEWLKMLRPGQGHAHLAPDASAAHVGRRAGFRAHRRFPAGR